MSFGSKLNNNPKINIKLGKNLLSNMSENHLNTSADTWCRLTHAVKSTFSNGQ